MTETSHELRVTRWGGPEVLSWEPTERPEPGPGEVRISVEASALSYTDMLIRRGIYPNAGVSPPFVSGYTCVGRVDKRGEGVEDLSVGDRVADLCVTGGAASHVIRPAASVVRVPNSVDAAQAEVMVLTYLTSYQALFRTGDLSSGDPVLVLGASGATGHAALDIGRQFDCAMTGVASNDKRPFVKAMGATPLAYDAPGYRDELKKAADAVGGFQVILDGVADIPARQLVKLLRPGGRVVGIGFAGPVRPDGAGRMSGLWDIVRTVAGIGLTRLMAGRDRVQFYIITNVKRDHPDWFAEDLGRLYSWLEAGQIQPCIAERYPFEEAVEGHRHLARGGFAGRLVLIGDLVARQDPEASQDNFAPDPAGDAG